MKQQNSIVAAQDFLRQTRMDPGAIDMETGVGIFLEEMEAGLEGRESSLKMLPTYISPEGDVPANTPVLVLDAGGTNFRVARVSFSPSGEAEIESFVKHPMPGSRGPVDRDTFFNTIVDYMANHLNDWNEEYAPTVGFCFSYPTEIYPDGEGRLVHFTKEVRAPEEEGQLIASGLNEALKNRGFPTP